MNYNPKKMIVVKRRKAKCKNCGCEFESVQYATSKTATPGKFTKFCDKSCAACYRWAGGPYKPWEK